MSPSLPKINVNPTSPHTPHTGHSRWGSPSPGLDSPPAFSLSNSPGSPVSPRDPLSPPGVNWAAYDAHVSIKGMDSPQSNLPERNWLARQPSIKRKPIKAGELTLGKVVGTGSFSRIYQGYGPSGIYAVKTRLPSTDPKLFANERKILAMIHAGAHQDKTRTGADHVVSYFPEQSDTEYLVFRLYDSNIESFVTSSRLKVAPEDFDFFDYRRVSQPLIGLDLWVDWAMQLVSGLQFVHSLNIVHSDLKPDNILLSNDKLVIADFSGAISLSDTASTGFQKELKDGMAWSPVFTDPEVRLEHKTPSAASDIYSIGLILAFCATGQEPYNLAKNSTQRLTWMEKLDPLESYDMDAQQKLKLVKPAIEALLSRTFDGFQTHLGALRS